MLSSDLRTVYESYQNIYEEGDGISCEMLEEVVEELFEECLEFGHSIDESASVVEEAAIQYLMELNPYAAAGSKEARAYQKSTTATKRGEARKTAVKAAVGKAKAKAKGAVAAASIGASIAKDEARRAGRAAAHKVSSTVQKKKAEVKSGVKSLIGRGLRKAAGAVGKVASKAAGAASRLGEETVQEEQWIQKAIKHPGAFTKKAKAHGMTPKAFKQEVQAHPEKYPTKTERQANLMGTLGKLGEEYIDEAEIMKHQQERDRIEADKAHEADRVKRARSAYGKQSMYSPPTKGKHGEIERRQAQRPPSRLRSGSLPEEYVDIFDVVLEYLLETGHAETISEAQYIMTQMDSESIEAIVEARRADTLGHARGTAANPSRKDVPHGDPSQRSMLHSNIKSRADQMGRERRNSPRYKAGGRPALSKKEKSFLQASDRTRRSIRNPNVPDTGRHQNVGRYDREDQKNPRRNPKHNENKG
jgi:hypothetical protein